MASRIWIIPSVITNPLIVHREVYHAKIAILVGPKASERFYKTSSQRNNFQNIYLGLLLQEKHLGPLERFLKVFFKPISIILGLKWKYSQLNQAPKSQKAQLENPISDPKV